MIHIKLLVFILLDVRLLDACFSHTLGSASRVLRLRVWFARKVGDYPGSRLLSKVLEFGGTNRIVSQDQFDIGKVGDYPGSRQLKG